MDELEITDNSKTDSDATGIDSQAERLIDAEREIYKQGFMQGLVAYAWWNHGIQQVGTTGTTLKMAIEKVEETWNFNPPKK